MGERRELLKIKIVATIILLTLVLIGTLISLNHTLALISIEEKTKAETLLIILGNDNETIRAIIDRMDAQNILVPQEVNTTYNEGIIHAQEAIRLMNQEKYDQANSEAIDAMQKFEETLRLLDVASLIEPTEAEKKAEDVIALKANITRGFKYVEQLENLTAKIEAAGYNITEIAIQLVLVRQHLEAAERKIYTLNLEEVSGELRIVQRLFEELKEDLAGLTSRIRASNTEKYLQEAEMRVSAAKTNITASTTLTPETKEEAIIALNNSEASLVDAQDSLENNDVEEAIEYLEEAKKWEEEYNRIITEVASTTNSVAPTDESITKIVTTTSVSG